MVQTISTYLIVFLSVIYVLVKLLKVFFPSKNSAKKCDSCTSGGFTSCEIVNHNIEKK